MVRLLAMTMHFRVVDHCGITRGELSKPVIWLTWHNRILMMGHVVQKFLPTREGAVLASPSTDGEIIAQFMQRFGVGFIQGSSNKRSAGALKEMIRWVRADKDVSITPDGPRGPKYHVEPGAVKLAQLTRTELMMVHVDISRAWKAKTWDAFRIPKPFSTFTVTFHELVSVARTSSEEAFSEEHRRIEDLFRSKTGV